MGIFIAKQTVPGSECPDMGLKAENSQEKKYVQKPRRFIKLDAVLGLEHWAVVLGMDKHIGERSS